MADGSATSSSNLNDSTAGGIATRQRAGGGAVGRVTASAVAAGSVSMSRWAAARRVALQEQMTARWRVVSRRRAARRAAARRVAPRRPTA